MGDETKPDGLNKWLDAYAFIGVAVPGAALLLAASIAIEELRPIFMGKDVGIGNLGVFIVISYATGQFVQAFGNLLEWAWWECWGGKPIDWIQHQRERKGWLKWVREILTNKQINLLEKKLAEKLGLDDGKQINERDRADWHCLVRQAHSLIDRAGRIGLVKRFEMIYGLNRGMSVVFIAVAIAILAFDFAHPAWAAFALATAGAFLYRMHRFRKYYAEELLMEFLNLPPKEISGKAGASSTSRVSDSKNRPASEGESPQAGLPKSQDC